jgi:DNA-binding helix-hairpin-helix protein with protein kinase domain/predicted RNA-binding Zn-ribbon protein involved in translation (DUF1610 family)
MTEKFFADKQELVLGKKIAQGGEGKVFVLANQPKHALKAYLPSVVAKREDKIRAMVEAGISAKVANVAFPEKVVLDAQGNFAGFLMSLVSEHEEIHELQTPVSRQKLFPTADYRFIVRVAVNIARIFANVHSAGCVVGDINQRGILVAQNAKVVLIDADSFQFSHGQSRYLCEVGVPEYTPPELQGWNLKNVVRTAQHDAFGLAVCIFQLLCLDRHPFVGRPKHGNDITTEQAIKEFRFAYSARDTDMEPPRGTVQLNDFPERVRRYFEEAFSPNHIDRRPSPADWVSALEEMETSLRPCSVNRLHHYSRVAAHCPLCRMEATYGRPLFVSDVIQPVHLPNGRIDDQTGLVLDLQSFIASLTNAGIPDTISLTLPPVKSNLAPSVAALEFIRQKRLRPLWQMAGLAIAGLSLAGLSQRGFPPLLIFIGLGIAGWVFFRQPKGDLEIDVRYSELAMKVRKRGQEVQATAPVEKVLRLKNEAFGLIDEYKRLCTAFQNARKNYDSKRRDQQLEDFLSNISIRTGKIKGLNSSNLAALNSYNFFSAYDVKRRDVQQVYGIGPVKKTQIMNWVKTVEQRFQYNPTYDAKDQQNIAADKAKIISKQQAVDEKLRELIKSIQAETVRFEAWKRTHDPELTNLMQEFAQAEFDLKHIGWTPRGLERLTPYKVPGSGGSSSSQTGSPGSAANASAPSCPSCGKSMIRRMARQGRNTGRYFWGCVNYPRCTGTRHI